MSTDTEMLKKRLTSMNKELTLHRCKLRRHAQNKGTKFTDNKVKCSPKFSDINIDGKYVKDPFPTLKDYLSHTVDSKDDVQDVLMPIYKHNTNTASKPEVTQNNASTGKYVTLTAVDSKLTASEDQNALGEENSLLTQCDISNEGLALTVGRDFLEHSTYSPPKKLMTHEGNNDLSPILIHRSCVTKSSAKPKARFLVKKMKGLASSTKSKRRVFPKQISLILNHDILHKLETNDTTNSENITDTRINDVGHVVEDMVPKKPQRNVFMTFPSCSTEGQILAAFFEDSVLVLVQELQVSFWRFFKSKEPVWSHVGLLPHQQLQCGISVGCLGNSIDIGSEKMFICSELWTSDEQEHAVLTCVIYSFNTVKAGFKVCCLELKRVPGFIKNIKFCIVPEFSIVISWQHCDSVSSTTVMKFSIDIESRSILKSTQLVPVMGIVNSVHCLKGCRTVVVGESASQLFLWNHCTGALVTAVQCPKHGAELQWASEDQGFLFGAVTTATHAELIIVNLTTGKQKKVREYILPQTNKLVGINVECGKMIAVFLEGFVCWDLAAGGDTTEENNGQ